MCATSVVFALEKNYDAITAKIETGVTTRIIVSDGQYLAIEQLQVDVYDCMANVSFL